MLPGIWYLVSVLSKRTMLTGSFFVLPLRVVCFRFGSPGCPCLRFYRFPQVPLGQWVRSGGGAVVVRRHSGDISRFPIEVWILGCNGYCVLVAGKLCPLVCVSLSSQCGLQINLCISNFASTRMADSLKWYRHMLTSS